MNKSVLLGAGLLSLTCLPVFGEAATTPSQTPPATATTNQTQAAPVQNQASQPPAAPITTPNTATPPSQPASTIPPETPTGTKTTAPEQTAPATNAAQTTIIDCNYHIPSETTNPDATIVTQWAEKAAQQTFVFDASNLDSQLETLKACYTDQGWKSFHDALIKSGNLAAIKKENLTVSSMIDGQSSLTAAKDNQWKASIPLQVVYQNGKEKVVQSLTINLVISRKVSGDLGIMQIIAMPRQVVNTAPPAPAATTEKNAPSTVTNTVPAAVTSPKQ